MVELLLGNGRLKLYHDFYNHRIIAMIVQYRVNDASLKMQNRSAVVNEGER